METETQQTQMGNNSRADQKPQELKRKSELSQKEWVEFTKGVWKVSPEKDPSKGHACMVKAEKNSPEQVRQRLRNIRDGFTIGDLSIATDVRESIQQEVQERGGKAQGLTFGDLCMRRTVEPSMSESQRLAAENIEAGRKQREEADRIRQFIFKDQLEQEERRQAAIIKVREMKANIQ